MSLTTSLCIRDFSFRCALGCLQEEQDQPQEVRVSLKFRFPTPPPACESDQLTDTVCYAEICEHIRKVGTAGKFRTVEHLGHAIYLRLGSSLPREIQWGLEVHKVHPPVDGLTGGVYFQIGDLS